MPPSTLTHLLEQSGYMERRRVIWKHCYSALLATRTDHRLVSVSDLTVGQVHCVCVISLSFLSLKIILPLWVSESQSTSVVCRMPIVVAHKIILVAVGLLKSL